MKWCLTLMMVGISCPGCTETSLPTQAGVDAADQNADDGDNAAAEKKKLVVMTKRNAPIVDKQKAMAANPKLIEVENKINANDYFSGVAQGYFAAASKYQLSAMKHSVDIMQAMNDRWPTHAEFTKMIKDANIVLNGLYAYQVYGYDDTTGQLCILEDRAEMKRQYEEAGRDYPHDD